jgi:NADH dehydrogenase
VDEHLRVTGDNSIFVVGDTAANVPASGSKALPGLAPVAKQMGSHVGKVIKAQLQGRKMPKPFKYRDWGTMATIGRNKAVVDFGWLKLSGFTAWIVWSLTHVAFLDGFTNRVSVGSSWVWSYLTWQRGARVMLIPVRPVQTDDR